MEKQERGQRRLVNLYEDYSGIKGTYTGIPFECYQPSENDVIVIRGDLPSFLFGGACGIYDDIKAAFKHNNVVFVPNNLALQQMTYDQLQKLLFDIESMIKKLLNDNNKQVNNV